MACPFRSGRPWVSGDRPSALFEPCRNSGKCHSRPRPSCRSRRRSGRSGTLPRKWCQAGVRLGSFAASVKLSSAYFCHARRAPPKSSRLLPTNDCRREGRRIPCCRIPSARWIGSGRDRHCRCEIRRRMNSPPCRGYYAYCGRWGPDRCHPGSFAWPLRLPKRAHLSSVCRLPRCARSSTRR